MRLLHALGAYIVFGDINTSAASELLSSLRLHKDIPQRVIFVKMNVAQYVDHVDLFGRAMGAYGHVDHAISIAGVPEHGDWFGPSLSTTSVEDPPSTRTLDVNLLGACYFARVAIAYLRSEEREPGNHSLTLMSSVAGFKESAIPMYQVSKHGVLGLMRTLKAGSVPSRSIRVNALCPWMTETGITESLMPLWKAGDLPLNTEEQVARVISELMRSKSSNGRALYVEGGRAWDIQEGLDGAEGEWWGKELSSEWARSRALVAQWNTKGGSRSKES